MSLILLPPRVIQYSGLRGVESHFYVNVYGHGGNLTVLFFFIFSVCDDTLGTQIITSIYIQIYKNAGHEYFTSFLTDQISPNGRKVRYVLGHRDILSWFFHSK
jgi:hypothetical protein